MIVQRLRCHYNVKAMEDVFHVWIIRIVLILMLPLQYVTLQITNAMHAIQVIVPNLVSIAKEQVSVLNVYRIPIVQVLLLYVIWGLMCVNLA